MPLLLNTILKLQKKLQEVKQEQSNFDLLQAAYTKYSYQQQYSHYYRITSLKPVAINTGALHSYLLYTLITSSLYSSCGKTEKRMFGSIECSSKRISQSLSLNSLSEVCPSTMTLEKNCNKNKRKKQKVKYERTITSCTICAKKWREGEEIHVQMKKARRVKIKKRERNACCVCNQEEKRQVVPG